ncbi:DUF2238 domain-containing protein [Candidatus Woesearchaeota archaeon]|nr:DUF2238 domain-containing protein [Candidatus Woesearchaeota archaeon]
MHIKKSQKPIIIVNIISIIIFSFIFFFRKNYEFAIYIGVILFFLFLILKTNEKIDYPDNVLWGLTAWSILHMAGGGIRIGENALYGTMLWPIAGEPYNILKYDQLVHAYGFAVATLVSFHLLKPSLSRKVGWISVGIVVAMAGVGLGALNEVIEFLATVLLPQTGVGGYENTALDLVANLIGAVAATFYIIKKEKKR